MAWVSPTGFVDTGNKWSDEPNAYDDNIGTYAKTSTLDAPLALSIDPITGDKVRVYVAEWKGAASYNPDISVIVFYGDYQWESVYEGIISKLIWVELPLLQTQSDIFYMKIYFNDKQVGGSSLYVYEADFWEVEAPPSYISQLIMIT